MNNNEKIFNKEKWQIPVYNDTVSCWISPLSITQLPLYVDVIRKSFATVANDFGFIREKHPWHTSFITEKQLAERFNNNYHPYGCFKDGKLIGFVSLTNIDDDVYELNHMSVLPGYRHFGYGRVLLDFCKERIIELGGTKIIIGFIEEHVVLKKWYHANGFVHTGTKKYEEYPFTVGYMEWNIEK